MRFTQAPPTLLSFILVLLFNTNSVSAGPYPKNELHDFGYGYLMDRGCDSFCGFEDQYCCSAGETCFTNSLTIAECLTSAPAGGWQYYTTLTTETDLIVKTITYSSFTGVAATTTATNPETTVACQAALGQIACGAICCKSTQYCAEAGQCLDSSTTTGATSFSAPVLGTSGASTITRTATTTVPFETPVGTGGSSIGITSSSTSSHSLSGGAIAGIVIGVLAAILLLILLCFCCIVRSGFNTILALFGLGPKRRGSREEVITTEERYSRHNAGSGAAAQSRRGWFGGAARPQRTTTVSEKRSSRFGNMGYIGAGLLGLAAILGLQRRSENKKVVKEERTTRVERDRSDISSEYYSDYYTDPSSVSDDRQTRTTRHTNTRR